MFAVYSSHAAAIPDPLNELKPCVGTTRDPKNLEEGVKGKYLMQNPGVPALLNSALWAAIRWKAKCVRRRRSIASC